MIPAGEIIAESLFLHLRNELSVASSSGSPAGPGARCPTVLWCAGPAGAHSMPIVAAPLSSTSPLAASAPLGSPWKLVVVCEADEHRQWLSGVDFAARGISAVLLLLDENASETTAGRRVPCRSFESPTPIRLPSFSGIVEALGAERPAACLVLGDGAGSRMVSLAADLMGTAVFTLVMSPEQLANLHDRTKARPDLFFLADQQLFPDALRDWRYGSTLLPAGHPGQDGTPACADAGETSKGPRWGGGRSAWRLLDAMERWAQGTLDPASAEVSVVVPAFREAENLPLVCERLLEALEGQPFTWEVLLIDDASPDDTYRVALAQMWRSPRIRAFTKPPPRGMGNAIRHGLARARGRIVAITMGDGSDEVAKIPEMVAKVRDEGYSLAIGSRYRHRVNYQTVPRLYRFWSWCFRWCTRMLIGVRLSDYTNAFRVYETRIFSRYGPESPGFEISPESTFKAWFATRRVAEVDVRHLKRAAGQSTFSFLRAGPGYGKILAKALVNRWTGRWFTIEW